MRKQNTQTHKRATPQTFMHNRINDASHREHAAYYST
jgi:hypothetical protein